MIEILFSWIILIIIFSGVGSLVVRELSRYLDMPERLFTYYWTGWCLTIGFLQIWHFFYKVNALVWIPVGIAAIIGWILTGKEIFQWIRSYHVKPIIIFAFLTCIFGFWLANRVLIPSTLFDSAAYHMQMVMWNSAYPIVPGLGNLHYRFAFNNSSFLYSAMTDVLYWDQRSYHISNSLLVFFLILQTLFSAYRMITNPLKRPENLFMALMFFPAVYAAYDYFLVTYSPDLPVYVLGIILSAQLLAFLYSTPDDPKNLFRFLLIAIIGFTGITVKLSFVGLVVPAFFSVAIVWIVHRQTNYRPFIWSAAFGVLYLIPWMIRGVLLSGYIAFPLTIGAMPVVWRVPEYRVIDAREWIQSWARLPNKHWGIVNSSNVWIVEWLQKIPESIVTLLLIFLFFTILAAFLFSRSKSPLIWKRWLFFITPLVSLLFWLYNAPDVRFAGAGFWILAFGAVTLAFSFIDCPEVDPMALRGVAMIAIIALMVFPLAGPILLPHFKLQPGPAEFDIFLENFQTGTTKSGFTLRFPASGEIRCWKIPIPCAQWLDPYLSLIDEGDMAKGFKMDPQMPYPVPRGFSASEGITIQTVSGWFAYKPETQKLWMGSPSQFLFYVGQPKMVELRLTSDVIMNEYGPGMEGEVMVKIDNKQERLLALSSKHTAVMSFSVNKGYHLVELTNPAGNFMPKESDAEGQKDEPYSLSFSEVRIEVVR